MMSCVLAYSGGLDSTVLLYYILSQKEKVHPLFFRYGSKHNAREYESAQKICNSLSVPLKVVDLSFMSTLVSSSLLEGGEAIPNSKAGSFEQKKTVVPGRNSIFGSVLIGYADAIGASRIALANHADDHATFPDTRPEWVAALRLLAYHGTMHRVALYTPFTETIKREVILLGQKLKVPFERSWTCYEGGKTPCGACLACTVRREAFLSANLVDPLG